MLAGLLRINQRNYREAYISAKDDKDILIEGVKDRNRAMEGDEVVVLIKPRKEWKGGPSGQKTAKVVKITQYNHQRTCVGQLNLPDEITNINFYIFSPRDSRIPRLRISKDDIPEEVKLQREVCRNYIWHVRIDEWVDISFADGTILQLLGISGDIECETAALMLELGLDLKPIPKELDVYYPQVPFSIPEEELNTRTDLRNECIFTIDPATAKDLDDAVSCKVLPNGNFEVGVHISDVTYFLQEGTPLDTVVSKRATTVYLVQRQYHMLPLDLCSICSLTPGVDKLAFSVIFEITPDAEVVSRRFCRSVINSCSQFAYEHAQFIIENPDMELNCEDFPKVSNGFGPNDCATCVKYLYKLSLIMRNRRYSTGALRLDVPKLYFSLDPETHRPTSCFLYEVKDSHRLIEEFMLLANMAVAEHIYQVYPNLAFLRNHGPPILHLITELQEKLSRIGININITSAGNLHSSLSQYLPKHPANHFDWLRSAVLYNLCSRPMKRALYFIPNPDMDKEDFYHYALNSRFYTHFTSPIRRYADIMVHRLLAAAIGCRPKPLWTEDYSQTVARTCNMKKYNAKLAGDRSSLLYLALYLEDHGPIVTHAGVFDVRANSFDCIVYSLGILLRIYLNQCNAEVYFTVENGMSTLEVIWDENLKQTIQILSIVNVQISKHNGLVKVNGILLPPAVV